jgi:hypothetical protein
VISLDNVVGIKKSFIVTYRVLYLLPDPVGNQVIDLILVLMKPDGFVRTVVGVDLLPLSGIGIQILAEIVFGFSFIGSQGVEIVDRFFDLIEIIEFSSVEFKLFFRSHLCTDLN